MKKLALVFVALGAAACATTQAKVPVDRAPLEVPPVPPRVIEALPPPPPPPVEPVGPLPPVSPTNSSRTRPPAQKDTAKPDPKAAEIPPVEAAPAQQPPPQAPVPPLRTPGTPDAAEASKQIRDINARAQSMLDAIDYRGLDAERKAQYDSVKMFISQAEDAIKAANFEFGKNMAEKAERLVKELRSR